MDHRDLDTYLRARRQLGMSSLASTVALVLAAVAGTLLFAGVGGPVMKGVLLGSMLGALLVKNELGLSSWVVPRKALLGIIEHQIGRDADALIYLAGKR